ncbi:MAG: M20 family metallo-hydrolase [Deltaproteobacteria bacterium]|nr:M20 family metallo-hydrolase [Deltaproteobacteria bacterium]
MTGKDLFTRVAERLGTYQQQMIDMQRELVSRVAVGPNEGGPGEGEKAAFLSDLLRGWGLKVANFPAPDDRVAGGERPNLVAWVPGRRPEKIWVLSHLDVVPPGEEALWDYDPFTLRVDGDRLYGRGTEDNHQGIVISLMAVKALLDLDITPPRTLALALVSDEETGSQMGAAHLLREHPQLFGPEDLIIVPDAGNPDSTLIEVAEKSLLWLRLELQGKQCHASRPDLGRNSLRACAHVIVALEELAREFPLENPLFRPPASTFEPTKKEANVPNINTVPGLDVLYLDCRVLPEYDLAQVKERVRALGEEAARRFGVSLKVAPVQEQSGPPTAIEAPVVQALTRAIREVYGREAKPRGIGGGTVAAFFRQQGLPAAVWMTVTHTAHQPNEFCLLSNLLGDARVLAHVFLEEE